MTKAFEFYSKEVQFEGKFRKSIVCDYIGLPASLRHATEGPQKHASFLAAGHHDQYFECGGQGPADTTTSSNKIGGKSEALLEVLR